MKQMSLEGKLNTTYDCYSGFYFGGMGMSKGTYFQVDNKVTETKQVVELRRVARVQMMTGERSLWMRVRLLVPAGDDPDLLCPLYVAGELSWLPLRESTLVVIDKLIHVLPHPLRKGILCHNTWIKKEIVSRTGN